MDEYRVIYADPPWQYKDTTLRFAAGARLNASSAEAKYPTMPLQDIVKLDIPPINEGYLFLWVTNSFIRGGGLM